MTDQAAAPSRNAPENGTRTPQSPTYANIIPSRSKASRRDTTVDDVDEDSPLLKARDSDDEPSPMKIVSDLEDEIWQGEERETRSSWYLFLLTLGSLG
jgi:hypothetical protein